ncbi:MAG: mandelate racemase/muconate lactonizing enzyme family protein [Candidatus Bathyarchaeia archaeon]
MKITGIRATKLSFRNREIVPSTPWREMNRILVEVETDEGITGIGEAFQALSLDAVVALVEGGLKRLVVGEDPSNIERLVHRMLQSSTYLGRTGVTRHPAREAVGDDVEIMVDANCPWTRTEALSFARACEEYDVRWLEEPIQPADDLRGLAWLRASTDIPIASGENESTLRGFMLMMGMGAVDVLQPSVTKIGGLLLGKKVCALAEAFNVEVAPHSWTLPMGVAASTHLAISSPSCTYVEVPPELEENPLKTPLRYEDGYALPPEEPGLGIELDEGVISKHTLTP